MWFARRNATRQGIQQCGSPSYLPATFRNASLILSCHPGPPSWKCSSTSRSIRKETSSFALGMEGRGGGASAGLVVAFLKAASAASRTPGVLRVRSAGIWLPSIQNDPTENYTMPHFPARLGPGLPERPRPSLDLGYYS